MSLEETFYNVEKYIMKVEELLSGEKIGSKMRDTISASLVSIVMQHYITILHTTKVLKQLNSAFALLRPLVDASYRAVWVIYASTETQLAHIGNGKKQFLSTEELSKKIDLKMATGGAFHRRYYANSALLHGMTHGGLELIGRQMKGNNIEPNFTDNEIVALLDEATMNYGMLLSAYGFYLKNTPLKSLGDDMVTKATL